MPNLVNGQHDDRFTSSSSDDWDNDSDFIQKICMSNHTSYVGVLATGDSDNIAGYLAMRDSCAAILDASTWSNFSAENQTIERTTMWPSDSANDHIYHNRWRTEIDRLNPNGSFRTCDYIRRTLRMSSNIHNDSDGNNWGN